MRPRLWASRSTTAKAGILCRVLVPEESTLTLFGGSFGLQPLALDPHRLPQWRVSVELCSQDGLRKQERSVDTALRLHFNKFVCTWLC